MTATAVTKSLVPAITDLAGLVLTFSALDNTNGNSVVSTGSERIIFQNTTGGALTATITGQKDPSGRTTNWSKSIPANAFWMTSVLPGYLWADTNGLIQIPSGLSASINIAVIYGG